MGAVDQPRWHSLHTKKPAAQLQSKKRGQSLSGLSAYLKLNYGFCDYIKSLVSNLLLFFDSSGRKPRHRRAESPTPDIIVKKDKYNKGTVAKFASYGPHYVTDLHLIMSMWWQFHILISSLNKCQSHLYIKVSTEVSAG